MSLPNSSGSELLAKRDQVTLSNRMKKKKKWICLDNSNDDAWGGGVKLVPLLSDCRLVNRDIVQAGRNYQPTTKIESRRDDGIAISSNDGGLTSMLRWWLCLLR